MTITRKLLILAVIVAAAAAVSYVIWFTYPKKIDLNMKGIKYQLGEENKDMSKPVVVHIEGKMKRSLWGVVNFKGTIDVEGEEIPVPVAHRELNITLGKDLIGVITYSYIAEDKWWLYSYGNIYANRDFSKVAIAVYKKNDGNDTDPNSTSGGWTGEDGLMIAAPAKDRTDALEVTNELMEDYWEGAPPLK